MSDQERSKWNRRYRESASGADVAGADESVQPHPFLASLEPLLPREGRALDVAGGTGRHALWLARRGLQVTLLDIAEEGLARAAAAAGRAGLPPGQVTTLALDLDERPLPDGPFAVVVCTCFLHRRAYPQLASRLAPDGVLLVVHPTRRNLERHPSPGAPYLLEEGELPSLLGVGPPVGSDGAGSAAGAAAGAAGGLEVLVSEEGWSSPGPEGRHEARLAVRRPGR